MIDFLDKRRCIVRPRYELGEVKDSVKAIEGKSFMFQAAWVIDDIPMYMGEFAMISRDGDYPKDAPRWIASGDLEEEK